MEQVMGNQKFAVLLCSLTADAPIEQQPRDFFEDLFVNDTDDGLNRYWRDASHGNISLDGSEVFGWRTLPQSLNEFSAISDRIKRIQTVAEFFAKEGDDQVDFRRFTGIIVVTDQNVDLTSSRTRQKFMLNGENRLYRVVICSQASTHRGIAHEMGHTFGLDHSFNEDPMSCSPANDGRPGAYCDRWDIMSAENVNSVQKPRFGASGPLVNAQNMILLGWLHESRVHRFTGNSNSMQLRPLSRPDLPGALAIRLDNLLIEFRMNTGWDEGFGSPGILIHKLADQFPPMVPNDQHSVLLGFPAGEFLQKGGSFSEGDPSFGSYLQIDVMDIDPENQSAIISFRRKEQEGVDIHVPVGVLQWILEGVIGINPNGGVVIVPPRPPIRDILIGLAMNELAESLTDTENKVALRHASLNLISETAIRELLPPK